MQLLSAQNVGVSFGARELFSNVNFKVEDKDHIGLVGVNGAGKTTLFRLIIGQMQPDEGEIARSGELRLGYMEQHLPKDSGATLYQSVLSYIYRLAGYDADVRVNCQPFDGNTYECITSVHNTGSESIVLDRLSSGYVTGIGREGGAWHQKRFVLHICDSSWQGEGQWRRGYIENFGVYPTYNHNTHRSSLFFSEARGEIF